MVVMYPILSDTIHLVPRVKTFLSPHAAMDSFRPRNSAFDNSTHPAQETSQAVFERYEQERLKRIRPEGLDQYIVTPPSTRYQELYKDIWVDSTAVDPGLESILDKSHHNFLIVGAGYGGLCAAARLVQEGVDVKDIRLVDSAGGFGGTWWYNRFVQRSSLKFLFSLPV